RASWHSGGDTCPSVLGVPFLRKRSRQSGTRALQEDGSLDESGPREEKRSRTQRIGNVSATAAFRRSGPRTRASEGLQPPVLCIGALPTRARAREGPCPCDGGRTPRARKRWRGGPGCS